jgi:histidyl-tRNA synthetase
VYEACLPTLERMRDEGLNVSVDASDRKLEKKLKSADKQIARHVVFIGESELADKQFPIKDLKTGKQSKRSIEDIISELKSYRRN